MKIAWFSPLPPAYTGIGYYTVAVASALAGLAELTLWTDQAVVGPEIERIAPVQRFTTGQVDHAALNSADAVFYNIGNNADYHRGIFDVARTTPGIMVLHDTRLQHFLARYSETEGDGRAFYLDAIRRSYGAAAEREALAFIAGEIGIDALVERYPMTEAVADPGLCVIVHNEAERRDLARRVRGPVFSLPLAFGIGPALEPVPADGTLRLVVFGFIGGNRRLPSILEALAGLRDEAITLDIYGEVEPALELDALIARHGLHGTVRRHGFIDDLSPVLRVADLAINLRWPSMGEASDSQLRIWDAGLASVVTRTGWYASLPEDTVFFVEPEDDVAGLRAHLRDACRDLTPFRRAGQRGRALLEQAHRPEAYAAAVVEIAKEAQCQHGRRAALDLSRSAARRLSACGQGIALCAQSVAARIGELAGSRL